MLLLFMNEEDSFWMLETIVSLMMPPRYYTPSMDAALADQAALADLIKAHVPAVSARIQELQVPPTRPASAVGAMWHSRLPHGSPPCLLCRLSCS